MIPLNNNTLGITEKTFTCKNKTQTKSVTLVIIKVNIQYNLVTLSGYSISALILAHVFLGFFFINRSVLLKKKFKQMTVTTGALLGSLCCTVCAVVHSPSVSLCYIFTPLLCPFLAGALTYGVALLKVHSPLVSLCCRCNYTFGVALVPV